ncbi:nicotinamide mononucleotide transporter [Kordia sp. YSTF-M3]|uniref:Nicotinamide riboside transporter PnuC n=1 Tax=Kordia aestuariivivens TaxID=2759037 RepID=A0ABR7QAG6_9FLAO|nr:nicotinamide riboside transporter PnuC [Kordia aestuariivivens]MBC8755559.1 nicotinamide mononucleotide transporter [Kordia aestuariivivens]
MSQLFDFFLEPYKDAIWLDIILEFSAAAFGIASVWFAKKEKIWVFPTGIISTIIYIYLCYKFILYGDMIINMYYSIMSIYGWYLWTRVNNDTKLKISTTNFLDKLKAIAIFLFTAAFTYVVYVQYDIIDIHLDVNETIDFVFSNFGSIAEIKRITPYLDTITTGIFFSGMWLMAKKKIENWLFWIFGNIISVPLYFVKGLGFTAIQFTIFLILAIFGYIAWKKTLKNEVETA